MGTTKFCSKYANAKPILWFALAYIFAAVIMQLITGKYFNFSQFVRMEISIPKAMEFYSRFANHDFLKAYKWALIWDFPYMLAYGAFLFYTTIYLCCRKNPKLLSSAWLPIAAVLADIIENLLEFYIIAKFPHYSDVLLGFRVSVSRTKWAFIVLTLLLIIYMLLLPARKSSKTT